MNDFLSIVLIYWMLEKSQQAVAKSKKVFN